jgi:hypothetical protein
MECLPESTTLAYTSIRKMSTTPVPSVMNTQKRKRTVVSYAQPDPLSDIFSDDEDIATVPCDDSSDDESDNDDRTYSRHKVCFGHW